MRLLYPLIQLVEIMHLLYPLSSWFR